MMAATQAMHTASVTKLTTANWNTDWVMLVGMIRFSPKMPACQNSADSASLHWFRRLPQCVRHTCGLCAQASATLVDLVHDRAHRASDSDVATAPGQWTACFREWYKREKGQTCG